MKKSPAKGGATLYLVGIAGINRQATHLKNFSNTANICGLGTYQGATFVGFLFNSDSCISMFNSAIGFAYSTVTQVGILKIIEAGLKLAFPKAVAWMDAQLSCIFDTFISFVKTTPIGWIVAAILAIFAALVLAIVCGMIYCGYSHKGFVIGWKVPNIFTWQWVFDELV